MPILAVDKFLTLPKRAPPKESPPRSLQMQLIHVEERASASRAYISLQMESMPTQEPDACQMPECSSRFSTSPWDILVLPEINPRRLKHLDFYFLRDGNKNIFRIYGKKKKNNLIVVIPSLPTYNSKGRLTPFLGRHL
jgi:hypothetical protein